MNVLTMLIGFAVSLFFIKDVENIIRNTGAAGKRFIKKEMVFLGGSFILIILGFLFDNNYMVVLSSMAAAIAVWTVWLSGEVALQLVGGVVRGGVKKATIEIRLFLSSLKVVSLTLSFIAIVVAIKGVEATNPDDLLFWLAITLFFSMLTLFFGYAGKLLGWVYLGVIIFLVVTIQWFPQETKIFSRHLDAVKNRILVDMDNNSRSTYRAVTNTGQCQNGSKYKTVRLGTVVRVERSQLYEKVEGLAGYSSESMTEVVFKNTRGIYAGVVWQCPTRILGPQMDLDDLKEWSEKNRPKPYKKRKVTKRTLRWDLIRTFTIGPGEIVKTGVKLYDGDDIELESDQWVLYLGPNLYIEPTKKPRPLEITSYGVLRLKCVDKKTATVTLRVKRKK